MRRACRVGARWARRGRILALPLAAALFLGCSERPEATPRSSQAPAASAPAPTGGTGPEASLRERIARAAAGPTARAPQETDWTGGDAAHGATLYARYCSNCHGSSGEGDGLAAAGLNPKPRDFTEGQFYIDGNANDETGEAVDLARVIRRGASPFGGSPAMVAWEGTLSESDVRDLVAFVKSLSRG